jgi:hypothetical protein
MRELVPLADDYDFSKYQSGDVICIPMGEISRLGQARSILLVAAIANAATRAGLSWVTERDDRNNELRVSFR